MLTTTKQRLFAKLEEKLSIKGGRKIHFEIVSLFLGFSPLQNTTFWVQINPRNFNGVFFRLQQSYRVKANIIQCTYQVQYPCMKKCLQVESLKLRVSLCVHSTYYLMIQSRGYCSSQFYKGNKHRYDAFLSPVLHVYDLPCPIPNDISALQNHVPISVSKT